MTSAVLFDLYGTLVDIKTCEEDPSLWEELAELVNSRMGCAVAAKQLHHDYKRLVEEKSQIYGEGFVLPAVFHELLDDPGEEMIGWFASQLRELSTKSFEIRSYTIPLLNRLRAEGCRLALVSNTEGIFTNYDLDHYGLRSFFDAVILSSEVGMAKPDPEILLKALCAISITADSAVFVGDTLETDLAAAGALGIPCVLITRNPEGLPDYASNSLVSFARPVFWDIYIEVKRLLNLLPKAAQS